MIHSKATFSRTENRRQDASWRELERSEPVDTISMTILGYAIIAAAAVAGLIIVANIARALGLVSI